MLLRCTKKLLDVFGPGLAIAPAPSPDPEDWYANLVWFDRRKCLLVTHAGTLFSVFEPDFRAQAVRNTQPFVVGLIERELRAEGLPVGAFGALGSEDFRMAKTADRSVLGCMNDMSYLAEHAIVLDGGLAQTDVPSLNRALRRNINSARGYRRPIDLAVEHASRQPR